MRSTFLSLCYAFTLLSKLFGQPPPIPPDVFPPPPPPPNCGYNNPVPSGWIQRYCPQNITRIEYQIPIDEEILIGNTVDEIDDFLDLMVKIFQDKKYKNYFRLRTEKIVKFTRKVEELTINKLHPPWPWEHDARSPYVSSLKYRQTFDNFKTPDSTLKYQNDLTWEVHMTAPGTDFDYDSVEPQPEYEDILSTKLEPNVFVDPCIENDLTKNPRLYGNEATSYSAKIEFDEDPSFGTNDTNAVTVIDTSQWYNANASSFFCDCAVSNCICCDVEEFFVDFCEYYNDSLTPDVFNTFRMSTRYDYVLDIDFYWFKNGDLETAEQETSKGKFTFQIAYANKDDFDNDMPSGRSTEISMKLYKSKTDDLSNWEPLISFSEDLINTLTSQSRKSSKFERWIDHRQCPKETTTTPINICELEKDIGSDTCYDSITRFYHDVEKNKCIKFMYTGCGGNGNNFETRKKCREKCDVSNIKQQYSSSFMVDSFYLNNLNENEDIKFAKYTFIIFCLMLIFGFINILSLVYCCFKFKQKGYDG